MEHVLGKFDMYLLTYRFLKCSRHFIIILLSCANSSHFRTFYLILHNWKTELTPKYDKWAVIVMSYGQEFLVFTSWLESDIHFQYWQNSILYSLFFRSVHLVINTTSDTSSSVYILYITWEHSFTVHVTKGACNTFTSMVEHSNIKYN